MSQIILIYFDMNSNILFEKFGELKFGIKHLQFLKMNSRQDFVNSNATESNEYLIL